MQRTLIGPRSAVAGGLFSILFLAAPDPAAANLILGNDTGLSGTGSILTVQDTVIESGCVGRDPRTIHDVKGRPACLYGLEGRDEITSLTNTVRAGDIDGLTSFADLALVFDIDETGGDNSVGLDNLYLAIYDEGGNLVFSVAFDEDGALDPITLTGDGGDSSFPFVMDQESAATAAALTFDPDYYIGGGIELVRGTAVGGPDTLFLAYGPYHYDDCAVNCEPDIEPEIEPDNERDPNAEIPEPASMTLFGFALAGLGWVNRRRKDKQA